MRGWLHLHWPLRRRGDLVPLETSRLPWCAIEQLPQHVRCGADVPGAPGVVEVPDADQRDNLELGQVELVLQRASRQRDLAAPTVVACKVVLQSFTKVVSKCLQLHVVVRCSRGRRGRAIAPAPARLGCHPAAEELRRSTAG